MSLKDLTIGVIMGGPSSEREVSLRSGENVFQALLKKGYRAVKIDLDRSIAEKLKQENVGMAYVILHGSPGEDGTVQGLLELLGIPYTGSGVLGSSAGMNKIVSKQLFRENRIPTPPFSVIRGAPDWKRIARLGSPLIFKPYMEGSSVGVKKFKNAGELRSGIGPLIASYRYGLVEKFITGRNITIGVLEDGEGIRALPVLELEPENEFYDYEAKYTKGKTRFILPARLDRSMTRRAQDLAVRAHRVLWCFGVSRVDMIVKNRDIFVLEVNTVPGMTATSDLPAEAEKAGMSFEDLVENILKSGYERKRPG